MFKFLFAFSVLLCFIDFLYPLKSKAHNKDFKIPANSKPGKLSYDQLKTQNAFVDDFDYGETPPLIGYQQFGGSAYDYLNAIDIDENGNIYAVGQFSGDLTIGGDQITSKGNTDGIVVKLDASGELLWYRTINTTEGNECILTNVAVKDNDEIYFIGHFTGKIEVAGNELNAYNQDELLFAKVDNEGTITRNIDTYPISFDHPQKIVIDNSGNKYIASTESHNNNGESTLACFDNNDRLAWTKNYSLSLLDLAIKDSIMFLTGIVNVQDVALDENVTVFKTPYNRNIYVAKYNIAKGNFEWAKSINKERGQSDYPKICIGLNENLYLVGNGSSIVKIDSIEIVPSSGFFAKFSFDGKCQFLTSLGSTSTFRPSTINYELNQRITICEESVKYVFKEENLEQELNFEDVRIKDAAFSKGKLIVSGSQNGTLFSASSNPQDVTFENEFQTRGNTGSCKVVAMDKDDADNVYTLYSTDHPVKVKGKLFNTGTFLIKEDPNGNLLWSDFIPELQTEGDYTIKLNVNPNTSKVHLFFSFKNISFSHRNKLYEADEYINTSVIFDYNLDGSFNWSFIFDGNNVTANSITSDNQGNIYTTGLFSRNIKFGGEEYGDGVRSQAFVVKFNANGEPLWTKIVGKTGYSGVDWSLISTIDQNGNVILAGEFTSDKIQIGSVDLDLSTGNGNVLLAKLNSNGDILFAKVLGGSNLWTGEFSTWPTAIKVNNLNEILLKGWNGDSVYFDNKLLRAPGIGYANFISKISTNGDVIWAKSAHNSHYSFDYNQFDVDESDNIYISLEVRDTIYFWDEFKYATRGNNDNVLIKYDTNGELKWVKTMKSYRTRMSSVLAYAEDDILVGGYFRDNLQCDDQYFVSTNYNAIKLRLRGIIDGIKTPEKEQQIVLYPNPARGFISLIVKNASTYKIYDLKGQEVQAGLIDAGKNTLNLQMMQHGAYIIKVIDRQDSYSQMIIRK